MWITEKRFHGTGLIKNTRNGSITSVAFAIFQILEGSFIPGSFYQKGRTVMTEGVGGLILTNIAHINIFQTGFPGSFMKFHKFTRHGGRYM